LKSARPEQPAEVAQAHRGYGVVGTERFFPDRQRALEEL